MRQLQYLLKLFFFTALICGCKNQVDPNVKKAYYEAFTNNSTASNYVVFTAIDLHKKKSKEICCSSRSLIDAFIHNDLSQIDSISFIRSYYKANRAYDSILTSCCCDYSFTFKNPESLEEIGFYNYNSDSVKYYSMQKDIPVLIDSIQKNFNDTVPLFLIDYYKTDSRYLIHVLYKNGILCINSCGTGYAIVNKILK